MNNNIETTAEKKDFSFGKLIMSIKKKWTQGFIYKKYIEISEWICEGEDQKNDSDKYKHRRIIAVMISGMLLFAIFYFISTIIIQRYGEVINELLENYACDILICQITGSLLIMSIVSLLNEKGKYVYWTNTMEYMFKRPVVLGIRAICVYILELAVLSFVCFLNKNHAGLLVSFVLSNISLVIIIIRLVRVYYDKESILISIRNRYKVMKAEDKIIKLKSLRTSTIKAFMEKNDSVFVENCYFLLDIYLDETEESSEIRSIAKRVLDDIFTFCFMDYKEDWEVFYVSVVEDFNEEFLKYNIRGSIIETAWNRFLKESYSRLWIYGLYKDKVYKDEKSDIYYSKFGNHVLTCFEKLERKEIEKAGNFIWNFNENFSTYFAETLFLICNDNEKCYLINRYVTDELEKNYTEYSESCIKGYFYALYVLEQKISEKEFEVDTIGAEKKRQLLDAIKKVNYCFSGFLWDFDLVCQEGRDVSEEFKQELLKKYEMDDSKEEYYFGADADWIRYNQ